MIRTLFERFGLGRRERLGRMLVRAGIIDEEQLRSALEIQRSARKKLGQIIVEQKYASEYEVLRAIAKYYRVSATSLSDDFAPLLRRRWWSWSDAVAHWRIPISVKLSIAITFMICLTILTLSVVIIARQYEQLYAQTMRTGMVSLNYIAGDAALPLLEDDTPGLNTLIKNSASVDGLVYASVVDRNGVIRAHTDTSLIGTPATPPAGWKARRTAGSTFSVTYRSPSGAHLMNIARPVTYSSTRLGMANVGVSLDFIDRQIRRESLTIIVLSLIIVFIGISISIMIGVGFARPISQLVLATQEIGRGDFRFRAERVRGDEFGDLTSAFNYMSHELWKKTLMTKSFGSYVGPEILELVMAHPEGILLGGKRMEVTVVFTDVRGFTAYAENRDPEHVVAAINEYFEIVARHIQQRGGYVDKFIGDAVLGVFGVPLAQPDHARRGLRAAAAMQRELLAQDPERNPLLAKVGIGINSGVAMAGDLGSQVKRQYSVIGTCVNIASRINALAEGGQIIVSSSTREAGGDILEVRPLPPATIKGRVEPIEVYEVTSVREEAAAGPPVKKAASFLAAVATLLLAGCSLLPLATPRPSAAPEQPYPPPPAVQRPNGSPASTSDAEKPPASSRAAEPSAAGAERPPAVEPAAPVPPAEPPATRASPAPARPPTPAEPPESGEVLFAKAQSLYEAKKFEDAGVAADKLTSSLTVGARARDLAGKAWFAAGDAALKEERFGDAATAYRKAEPWRKEATAALVALEQRKREKAEELYNAGVRFFVDQKLDEAISSWEQTLELYPEHPNASKDIAKARGLQQKLKELR